MPLLPTFKSRKSTLLSAGATHEKTGRELRQENLNVSAGGVFYERAASRRSRHRLALQASCQDAVPLKRKRATSSCAADVGVKKPKIVFQDDRDEQDKQLDWRAFKRASVLRDNNPTLTPAKKREVHVVHVAKPNAMPGRSSKAEMLKKQESIRQALCKKMEKQIEEEMKKIDSIASKRASIILQEARARASPPTKKKKKCLIQPTKARHTPTARKTPPIISQPDAAISKTRPAPRLPKIAMRRKPVRPYVSVGARVVSR
jgi:hypothetical protein